MALDHVLSQISTQGASPRHDLLGRWTEATVADWEPQPSYGTFVDDGGRPVQGSCPPRAFLESTDVSTLNLSPELEDSLGGTSVVFLDWGQQSLDWEEIFRLWDEWDAQGLIVDCGSVGVPWNLVDQWRCPGWVAFRGSFRGAPLETSLRAQGTPLSFLARARLLRGELLSEGAEPKEESLPTLPFTLDDLNSGRMSWPQGVA